MKIEQQTTSAAEALVEKAVNPGKVVLEERSNPAPESAETAAKRPPRVPMSQLRRRLEVKEIPGWRLYWFKEENVPAAVEAYYEFVKRSEVSINPTSFAADGSESGNTDLGTNVSLIAGQDNGGRPVRLVLMKIPLEYFEEDQKVLEQRNSQIMQAIFGAEARVGEGGAVQPLDPATYTVNPYSGGRDKRTALFNRPKRKAKVGNRAT